MTDISEGCGVDFLRNSGHAGEPCMTVSLE